MRKLLFCVSLAIWGVISCGTGKNTAELGSTAHALTAPMPPVREYAAGDALPSSGYTHLVVNYCKQNGGFAAAFVDASSGTVVALLRGNDATLTGRFLPAAYDIGVPVTLYTAPVIVLSDEDPTASSPSTTDLPIAGVLHPTCSSNGDIGDPPPTMPPTGDEEDPTPWWQSFVDLAIKTAEALHGVSRAPPPPTRR